MERYVSITPPEILECELVYDNEPLVHTVQIKHGLKIRCDKSQLDLITSSSDLKEKFNLNIKRLNMWYWSVYFEEIEK